MSSEDARRRVEIQETAGALLQLDAKHPQAAALLAALTKVIAAEAVRTPRFAAALADALVSATPADGAAEVIPSPAPRKRAAPAKKVVRQPGAFDPFVVFRESGDAALAEQLSTLDLDGLRDIIAEQELDTRKETSRKRKPEVLVAWIVDRVDALASKGSAFR
jgi:hypothetical protein